MKGSSLGLIALGTFILAIAYTGKMSEIWKVLTT